MWERLAAPWQACLEEAWAAYCVGSVPAGAVVVDGEGQIHSRGRNRRRDPHTGVLPLAGVRLAHAELNALLVLSPAVDPRACTLYATSEPCPLCVGALAVANIRRLHYASREPWAGGVALLRLTPYLAGKGIAVQGPEDPDLEEALVAATVEAFLHGHPTREGRIVEAYRQVTPVGVEVGWQLFASGDLRRWRDQGIAAARVWTWLGEMVAAARARLAAPAPPRP